MNIIKKKNNCRLKPLNFKYENYKKKLRNDKSKHLSRVLPFLIGLLFETHILFFE